MSREDQPVSKDERDHVRLEDQKFCAERETARQISRELVAKIQAASAVLAANVQCYVGVGNEQKSIGLLAAEFLRRQWEK